MTYADVSRGIQRIFKERQEALSVAALEGAFLQRFGTTIASTAGVATREYLHRKQNVFQYDEAMDSVFLQPSILAGPPIADPNLPKDEDFVLDEFESLIADLGPICYVSALCGKFIQRNGISVTSITSARPLDLLKRHPDRFVMVGGGNVSIARFRDVPEVLEAMGRNLCKAQRTTRATQDAQLPVPEVISEQDVVEEFRRLIEQEGADSVYISSLCGRFLQRFRKPVTHIINSRPADFLRKYSEVFELVGGGHVRLRNGTAGSSSSSSAPPPPQLPLPAGALGCQARAPPPLAPRGGACPAREELESEPAFDDKLCAELLRRLCPPGYCEALEARVQELCDLLRERTFLRIEEMVLSGGIGKGLALRGSATEAQVVLLVDRLPDSEHEKWLPHVLETLLAVLEMALGGRAHSYRTTGGPNAELVLLGDLAAGLPDVPLALTVAPVAPGGCRDALLARLRAASALERPYFAPALARDALELVMRQSAHVRAAMRLLRWWAECQTWPSAIETPPAYLLELLVLLAAAQASVPAGGAAALVEAALDLCANLPELRVLWEGTEVALFSPSDVCPLVLAQAPLVLDPTNPCTNVADPAIFDCGILAVRASRSNPTATAAGCRGGRLGALRAAAEGVAPGRHSL